MIGWRVGRWRVIGWRMGEVEGDRVEDGRGGG